MTPRRCGWPTSWPPAAWPPDHLWQDLGLPARGELTALMRRNFPTLAARNVKDMKWKRFLYKQLCEAEGIYTCRAPSCQVVHRLPCLLWTRGLTRPSPVRR